ncbi:MAG: carboxypeptidase-like regulatory domain-containing protein [Bifidobacteriaceae bacterium]|nr:carboxypeptidase-like regulatory domain-containing protein [Bifidobacteriaceae bacterium]
MVEVVVSIAVLVVFTTAAAMAVSAATATSVDNRARVGAAALAQRELELAAEEIAWGKGADAMRAEGEVDNPNAPPGAASGDAEYGYKVDGVNYRVTRRASLWEASRGSACDSETISDKRVYGTLVAVTVTWRGMGDSVKPHIAQKVFPPKRDETLGLDPTKALLAVKVEGAAAAGGAGSGTKGVRVEVTGPGAPAGAAVTNARGCVALEVAPPAAGGSYKVTLLGDGANTWVTPGGAERPSAEVSGVTPGASRIVEFPPYDKAARLIVLLSKPSPAIGAALIEPASQELGVSTQASVDASGRAEFTGVYPGTYYVSAGDSVPVTVHLAPGQTATVEVDIP